MKNELNVKVLENWDSSTLAGAECLCMVASDMYGGVWVVMLETEKTVTVWLEPDSYENYKAAQPKRIRTPKATRNTAKVS